MVVTTRSTRKSLHNARNPFLALPSELHLLIFEQLGYPATNIVIPPQYPTWAALERTCKLAQFITEPYLYHMIYTNVRTNGRSTENTWQFYEDRWKDDSRNPFGTAALVILLKRRPRLQRIVHHIVLDEFDPVEVRKLLSLKLDKLKKISCQHEGDVKPWNASELEHLNASLRKQEKMTMFVFNVRLVPGRAIICPLQLNDAPLFKQPSLTRLRVSYMDFRSFDQLPLDYFADNNLRDFNMEQCECSLATLTRLLRPCQNLSIIHLFFQDKSIFTPEEEANFLPLVESIAGNTLKILQLPWSDVDPHAGDDWPGWDLRNFTALRCLHVSPNFLFDAKTYTEQASPSDLHNMLIRTLPPNLKILAFDGMIPAFRPADLPEGYGLRLPERVLNVLQAIVTLRQAGKMMKSLSKLLVFYCEHLASLPMELWREAKRAGMRLGFMYLEDLHILNMNFRSFESNLQELDKDDDILAIVEEEDSEQEEQWSVAEVNEDGQVGEQQEERPIDGDEDGYDGAGEYSDNAESGREE